MGGRSAIRLPPLPIRTTPRTPTYSPPWGARRASGEMTAIIDQAVADVQSMGLATNTPEGKRALITAIMQRLEETRGPPMPARHTRALMRPRRRRMSRGTTILAVRRAAVTVGRFGGAMPGMGGGCPAACQAWVAGCRVWAVFLRWGSR